MRFTPQAAVTKLMEPATRASPHIQSVSTQYNNGKYHSQLHPLQVRLSLFVAFKCSGIIFATFFLRQFQLSLMINSKDLLNSSYRIHMMS